MKPRPEETASRYARQLALPEVGIAGQRRLGRGRVLVVGAGGLGSPAALYLAAAGVGTLALADADTVDVSNLQRQVLYDTHDVGVFKVDRARERLLAMNPAIHVVAHRHQFMAATAAEMLNDVAFVIDASDNFTTKFLIADACHAHRIPYSHAGIDRFLGQTMTVLPGHSACYRCVFAEPPPAPRAPPPPAAGPLGYVPGVIGAIQAGEAIRFLLGIGELLTDRLLIFDALAGTFRQTSLTRQPACRLCGTAAQGR